MKIWYIDVIENGAVCKDFYSEQVSERAGEVL